MLYRSDGTNCHPSACGLHRLHALHCSGPATATANYHDDNRLGDAACAGASFSGHTTCTQTQALPLILDTSTKSWIHSAATNVINTTASTGSRDLADIHFAALSQCTGQVSDNRCCRSEGSCCSTRSRCRLQRLGHTWQSPVWPRRDRLQ